MEYKQKEDEITFEEVVDYIIDYQFCFAWWDASFSTRFC